MFAKNIEVYTAESKVRDVKGVFETMLFGLLRGRYLAYRLFIKEIKADYSQSGLGIVWDFLEPIALAAIFILLKRGNVINSGDIPIPYHVFVIYGILLWQTFLESLTLPLSVMQRSKTLLNSVKVPPEVLLLSLFFKVSFNSCFRILVMFFVSILHERVILDRFSEISALVSGDHSGGDDFWSLMRALQCHLQGCRKNYQDFTTPPDVLHPGPIHSPPCKAANLV